MNRRRLMRNEIHHPLKRNDEDVVEEETRVRSARSCKRERGSRRMTGYKVRYAAQAHAHVIHTRLPRNAECKATITKKLWILVVDIVTHCINVYGFHKYLIVLLS